MGTYNALLEQRYSRLLRIALGLQEQGGVDSVAPELMPVYVLEGERGELARWKGERLGVGQIDVASALNSLSAIQLFNPVGSGVIAWVEMATGSLPALNGSIEFEINNAALATLSNAAISRDLRDGIPAAVPVTALQIRTAQLFPASLPGTARRIASLRSSNGQENVYYRAGLVLVPGTGLILHPGDGAGGDAVTQAVRATFAWRERGARADELAG